MLTVAGQDASVRWGYQVAAVLRAWTLSNDHGHITLTATVMHADTFRLTQQPLVLCATHPNGVWRFPIVDLQCSGASFSATLGPREIPNVLTNCAT
jgi:hypothetical protein